MSDPSIPLFDDLAEDLAQSNRTYSDRLLGDRLTAEFQSPLNRENRRRKLRAPSAGATLWQDPEQIKLAE